MLKIVAEEPLIDKCGGEPGEVIAVDASANGSITVACGTGAIKIFSLIPEGKGKMSAGDFLRGRKIAIGDVLK